MYVVTYYIVFVMGNESTMVNSKKIQILYYCFTLQYMIYLSTCIWFYLHVVCLTCIDINTDIVYLEIYTVKTIWLYSRLERQSSKHSCVEDSEFF